MHKRDSQKGGFTVILPVHQILIKTEIQLNLDVLIKKRRVLEKRIPLSLNTVQGKKECLEHLENTSIKDK